MASKDVRGGSDNVAGGGVKAGEKPRRLGKGLSSLIGEAVRVLPGDLLGSGGVGGSSPGRLPQGVSGGMSGDGGEMEGGRRLVMVEVGRVAPSRWQPRTEFDDETLAELAESIKTTGLMQPIVVRVFGGTEDRWTKIVDTAIGERSMAGASVLASAAGAGGSAAAGGTGAAAVPVPGWTGRGTAATVGVGVWMSAPSEGAPAGASAPVLYELVAGERRWRAARLAGLARLPAIVVEISDQEAAEWGLVENVQREDLSPFDKAAAFKRLSKEFGLTHEQIGKRVGVGRTVVTAHLLLLELEDSVIHEVRGGHLTMAHARLLLNGAVRPGSERVRLAQIAASEGWSYRKLEAHVHELAARDSTRLQQDDGLTVSDGLSAEMRLKQSAHERQIATVRAALSERLGTKVKIEGRAARIPGATAGRLVIDFYTLEQFEGLLAKMGVGRLGQG